jgi:regulator of replication initiation timing
MLARVDEVDRQRVGSALRRMGEDLVAERRQVMLLTRENARLRAELERLRAALAERAARAGEPAPGAGTGSAPELVGQ